MSSSLLSLSQVLAERSEGVIVNPDVLRSSANSIKKSGKGGTWSYEVAGLTLRVDAPQNTLPSNCASPLTIELDLEVSGDCEAEPADELSHLILDLVIRSGTGAHICAWHLDRHIVGGHATEAHPLFHFQHGGHVMDEHAEHLGRTMLLPAPRFACPPLDAVLAIDFVLSNFAGQSWQALRDEPTYLRLIRESQLRFWRPYIVRLAEWWEKGNLRDQQKITALWPHLA